MTIRTLYQTQRPSAATDADASTSPDDLQRLTAVRGGSGILWKRQIEGRKDVGGLTATR
jgi:hypothetical protein